MARLFLILFPSDAPFMQVHEAGASEERAAVQQGGDGRGRGRGRGGRCGQGKCNVPLDATWMSSSHLCLAFVCFHFVCLMFDMHAYHQAHIPFSADADADDELDDEDENDMN